MGRWACLLPLLPGEFNAEWMAGDFRLCRGPRRHTRSCQQRSLDPDGERGPRLFKTGARKFDGGLEVFHFLRIFSFSSLNDSLTEGGRGGGGRGKETIQPEVSLKLAYRFQPLN